MIIKAWVKFDGLDVECICTNTRRKECGPDYECQKYVIKFMPIMSIEEDTKELNKTVTTAKKTISKFNKEIEKLNKRLIR